MKEEWQKGKNPTLKRRWENAVSGRQLDSALKETHVFSVMIQHMEADARLRDEKGQHSSPALDTRARTDGEKVSGKRESSSDVRRRIPCRDRSIVQTRRVRSGILPCVRIASPNHDAYIKKRCYFQHVEAEESPKNKSKKEVVHVRFDQFVVGIWKARDVFILTLHISCP